MTTVSILNEIKEFLQEKVATKIRLQKADNNINNYELINPNVFVGWIPPEGYLNDGMEAAIPCMIIGTDEGNDDNVESELKIRISFVVYSPGEHIINNGKNMYTPSFKGYEDLLNLIDLSKAEIIKNTIINNTVTVNSECKWGMYQEQPYPYWYGWLSFSVRTQPYPKSEIEKMLLER